MRVRCIASALIAQRAKSWALVFDLLSAIDERAEPRAVGRASLRVRRSSLRGDCPCGCSLRGCAGDNRWCPARGHTRSDTVAVVARVPLATPHHAALLGAAQARSPPTARGLCVLPPSRPRTLARTSRGSLRGHGSARSCVAARSMLRRRGVVASGSRVRLPTARLCGTSGGLRGLRIALRRCVERSCPSTEHRQLAQRDAARARASLCARPRRTEHRRAVGAQRRPPHRSAAGRPPTALRARSLVIEAAQRHDSSPSSASKP